MLCNDLEGWAEGGGTGDIYMYVMLCLLNHVRLFSTPGTVPARLLCPWDSPDKNTGAGAMSSSRASYQPRDQTQVSHTIGRF